MPPADPALSLRHAVALGLLQGPAELMPISSSAHTTLVPWLAGWPYAEMDGEARKGFELALHAGAGSALAIAMRGGLRRSARGLGRGKLLGLLAVSAAPAALAGLALRGPIERRLGGPGAIAAGLLAGAAALALADRGDPAGRRSLRELGAGDGLALGLAQACALVPGVSRNGATLAAARARGFGREDARSLSWLVALPVLLGASGAETLALARGRSRAPRVPAAAGAAAAFLSTLASARLLCARRRAAGAGGRGALFPYSLYRVALAALVLRRLRRSQ